MVRSLFVSGQAHTPRGRSIPFVLAAIAVLAAPTAGGADSARSSVSQRAGSLRAANTQIAAASRAAVLDLYSIDTRLASARDSLGSLDAQATTLRAERVSLVLQATAARRGLVLSQRGLADRIRVLYEQGNVTTVDILLGAKSLDEAVSGIDTLDRVNGQDERVLEQLRDARNGLATSSHRLAGHEAQLAQATRAARATAAALAQARSTRTTLIASLAAKRSVNASAIAGLEAQAQAARTRSRALTRGTPDAAVPVAAAPAVVAAAGSAPVNATAGARTLTVSATGYSLPGRTATGLPAGWGVVAVDPSVIPLGTHMTIPGYGTAVAADTGGAVTGATIDLWFPTVAQALAWGRRAVTITLDR